MLMSLMASFVLSFFPRDVLDEIWDLIKSVSEGFPTYFYNEKSLKKYKILPFYKLVYILLKVNGYTFKGSGSSNLFFASLLNWGHFLKIRICSAMTKILFFQSRPNFVKTSYSRLANRNSRKYFFLSKHGRERWRVTHTP